MGVYSEEQLEKLREVTRKPSSKSSSRTGGKNNQTKLLEEYLRPLVEAADEEKGIDNINFAWVVEKIIELRKDEFFDENTPNAILKIKKATYKEDSSKTAEENEIQKQCVNSLRYVVQNIFMDMGRKPRPKKPSTQEVDVPEEVEAEAEPIEVKEHKIIKKKIKSSNES